jgi:hypothetical protein
VARRARKTPPKTTAKARIHQRAADDAPPDGLGAGIAAEGRLLEDRTFARITPHLGQAGVSTSAWPQRGQIIARC